MNDFQSNNPFPTSSFNPRPPQHRFPPVFPTMSPLESRILWCLVEGDTRSYYLRDIPIEPYRLDMFKLNVTVPIDPDHNLVQRLVDVRGINGYSTALSSAITVGQVFPEPLLGNNLHIVVQCPADDQPSSKRFRLTGPEESRALQDTTKEWLDFFHQLWGKGLEHFQDQYIESRTDDSGASFRIMKVHPAFDPAGLNGLLVRDEWDITWDCAGKECADGTSNFIIIGQTGIGKTLSLYYFLARRLALSLTTFFQTEAECVWLFNESGVRPISNNIPWMGIEGLSKVPTVWALVDSNLRIQIPARTLCDQRSPFFIVQAASPRNNRWNWVKYHMETRYFYTNPFSLNEIFQGNSVQPKPSNKDDLRDFFINYGPSARECYSTTSSGNNFTKYLGKLEEAIARMSLDEINIVLSQDNFVAKFNNETSYLVVLLRPADDTRMKCHATIITRTVMRLLWKTHRVHLKLKAKELFHMFSMNRETSVSAGWLFETIVHDALEQGIDVSITPMVVELNNRANAVNDKHVASDSTGTKRWKSSAMTYMPFTQIDHALVITPLHYYVPIDPSHPTYDSFTFEFAPCASYEGPILNPKNKEIYDKDVLDKNSDVGLFTIFQMTIAAEHDLNEKGLNYICMIADHNKLKAIGIRYGNHPSRKKHVVQNACCLARKDRYIFDVFPAPPTIC